MEQVVFINQFFAEINAEQKDNGANVPRSTNAIGYHNGLTMAKAIALKLAIPINQPITFAYWTPRNPSNPNGYHCCSNCKEEITAAKARYYKYCFACGAKMDLEQS